MSLALKYLEIVRRRGESKAELTKVYRLIRHKELYLQAYANRYNNKGALTPGTDPNDTIDGMSLIRIKKIINNLKQGTYQWKPVRRTYITKQNSHKLRPLGMPGWNDKLLAEVIRMILEAYYEPQFRNSSHGFRPQRGCHTALDMISKWHGTRWFIEGDIKGCFDNISHDILISILSRKIKDNRFLKLIRGMLEAGYMADWKYHQTYSGTPQGGIASPLLANIVLNELDTFIEDELIPQYTNGKKRKLNPEYRKLQRYSYLAKSKGNWKIANKIQKIYTKLPSTLSDDRNFRRLWYVRYADDFLLGFIGTKSEAEQIKKAIAEFLKSIKLDLSEEKTLITHALTEKVRFLNYEINLMHCDSRKTKTKDGKKIRAINSQLYFSIPADVVKKWATKVSKQGKVRERPELLNLSDYDIISTYETQLQGLINYYCRAHNQHRLRYLRYKWEHSLVLTLATKFKTRATAIYKKYRMQLLDKRKVIGIVISREGKKPLKSIFGKKRIQRQMHNIFTDIIQTRTIKRNGLLNRLLADKCELCGNDNALVEGHHIRKLKDLKKRYKDRKKPPEWVIRMIELRRKVLFVCMECHHKIHAGKYDSVKLALI